TANAAGNVTVSAASESQVGGTTLTVQSPPPTIISIAPATLAPGGTATITGAGFDTSLGGVSVTIRGAAAPIVTGTGTQLVVTVPCVESGAADVRVSSPGAAPVTRTHAVVTTQRSVPIGQPLILSSSTASACNELTATGGPARYLIAVFSAATSQNTLSAFELAGNSPVAGAVRAAPISLPATRLAVEMPTVEDERERRQARLHLAMLERNRQDYERLMNVRRAQPASSRAMPRAQTAADVALGDMRNVYFTFTGGCNDTTRVMRAKAIRVGTRSIIWEDSANVLQSSADVPLAEYYNRIGQIFDQEQYESVRRSFADPLLRDTLTDNDGKIAMMFSERLNGTGAAAYVTSCDQFPTTTARGSNFGQYFYGSVPVSAGSNVNSVSFPDGWFYFMTRTVVHEVKHIASLSARVANNAPAFEQSWLEEGTARHAEELWVRESMHHVPFKGNTGFGRSSNNGMYCDFHPSDATCNAGDPLRRPSYGVRRQFNEIRNKLLEPWNWSPYGDGTSQSGSVFYQTTWSLVRYAADRYGTSDSAFLRAITNATTNGVTNLTAVTGASLDQLIGGWGLALFADDYPGLSNASPDIQFATWNLRDIYASLHAAPLWTTRWNTPFPIAPVPLTNGAFLAQVPLLRGGAHAYFELTGAFTGPQLLSLRTNATTAPSTSLRIAIVRLQ
ncbi:MAG: IPT/TIG domain-containing protein, partial [Gemmatimonas sp.]